MKTFRVSIAGEVTEVAGKDLLEAHDDPNVHWFVRIAAVGDLYNFGGGAAPLVALERLS